MATAPASRTPPSTACIICCQLSVTSLGSCGLSGSDMGAENARAYSFARGDKRTSAEGQEWSSSLVRQGVSTVRKAMYEGDQTGRRNGSPPPNTMTKEGFAVRLGLAHSQALGHFVVEEAFAGHIRLHPLAIDHKLRNGAFIGAFNDFI